MGAIKGTSGDLLHSRHTPPYCSFVVANRFIMTLRINPLSQYSISYLLSESLAWTHWRVTVSPLFNGTIDVSLGGNIPPLGLKLLDQQNPESGGMGSQIFITGSLEVTVKGAIPDFYTWFLELGILVLRETAPQIGHWFIAYAASWRHCPSPKWLVFSWHFNWIFKMPVHHSTQLL